ncbi:MAG: glycosyltransferase [Thermoguttaceae bacterium]
MRRLCRDNQIDNPVVVTTFPCTVDTLREFRKTHPSAKQIYYCVDDWTNYPGLSPKTWGQMESEMLRIVDGAAFTSRELMESRNAIFPVESLYLPHGVDFDHFSLANKSEKVKVSQLESLNAPIVGFFGVIDSWVDIDAIAYLAEKFPRYSFVVIGRANVSCDVLKRLNNVRLLGAVPYAELPRYAAYFDVGLIPFLLNDLTKAVNPLKLMEYFAIGIPVISTPLPDIADAPGPIYFARSHDEFASCLDTILQSNRQTLRLKAQEAATANSWSRRAFDLETFAKQLQTISLFQNNHQ